MNQKKKQFCGYPGRKTVDVWILVRMGHFSELSFRSLMSHFSYCWKKNGFTKTHGSFSAVNPQVCLSTIVMSTVLEQVHSCDNSFFNNQDITFCISVNQNCLNWARPYQRFDIIAEEPWISPDVHWQSFRLNINWSQQWGLKQDDLFLRSGGVVCQGRGVL